MTIARNPVVTPGHLGSYHAPRTRWFGALFVDDRHILWSCRCPNRSGGVGHAKKADALACSRGELSDRALLVPELQERVEQLNQELHTSAQAIDRFNQELDTAAQIIETCTPFRLSRS